MNSILSNSLPAERAASAMPIPVRPKWQVFGALAADRLRVFWQAIWTPFIGRVRSQRKRLVVRDTTALGDRRFVSIIQVERQRFLIGYSPSNVTLLAQLPDEPGTIEDFTSERQKVSGEKN
jgi:hypothetical protein